MKPSAQRCTAFRALPWLAKANALTLCAALIGFSLLLWPQWRSDDNLSHGVFLPFLAVILFVESRRDASPRFFQPGAGSLAACTALILASLAALAASIVYAEALGWSHSMAEFMLSCALVFALGAAWLGFADVRVRGLPFNWAAAVGIVLWLFASPPPPGTYTRFAFFLQTLVTEGVVGVLNAAGVAAYQNGNVIELARTSVGVSEACSGVRSLISCTVSGLFLSAIVVRRPAFRCAVILLSPAIGLAMNFLRSLLLTLLANAGIPIEGRWHDLTGASILVGTSILVTALAWWLHRRESLPLEQRGNAQPCAAGRSPLQAMVAAALLMAGGTAAFLWAGNRPEPVATAAPELGDLLPAAPAGWSARTTLDLDKYSETLQTHALIERVYAAGSSPESARLTLYLAYWRAGQAPVSLVDAHTPDACWPGTGWVPEHNLSTRAVLAVGNRVLPPAEHRLFSFNRYETHVWFWHLHGGRPLSYVDPHSALRLLGLAWHYGFRPPEDQLFIRVSSNRPWPEIASQEILQQFMANLKPLGL